MSQVSGACVRRAPLPESFVDFWSQSDKEVLWAFIIFIGEHRGDDRLDFLLALDEYTGTATDAVRRALARAIFNEFVAVRARRPVGVADGDIRDIADVLENQLDVPADVFAHARRHVVDLLQSDYDLFRRRR